MSMRFDMFSFCFTTLYIYHFLFVAFSFKFTTIYLLFFTSFCYCLFCFVMFFYVFISSELLCYVREDIILISQALFKFHRRHIVTICKDILVTMKKEFKRRMKWDGYSIWNCCARWNHRKVVRVVLIGRCNGTGWGRSARKGVKGEGEGE